MNIRWLWNRQIEIHHIKQFFPFIFGGNMVVLFHMKAWREAFRKFIVKKARGAGFG